MLATRCRASECVGEAVPSVQQGSDHVTPYAIVASAVAGLSIKAFLEGIN